MNKKSDVLYKRVLLKISGELLKGNKKLGIDFAVLKYIAKEIKLLVESNIQIGLVIGGGNLFRGKQLLRNGVNKVISDHIGMLSTVMNGLAIYDIFNRICIKSLLISSGVTVNNFCNNYNYNKIIDLLVKKYVIIFVGGIGNPFFTTDSAACLKGIEIEADIVIKGTKVDGIFSSDPLKDKNVVFYDKLSYKDVLNKEFKVMDLSSFILARDYNMPICIFNITKPGALYRVVTGLKEGTLIC